jgi:hypothetical protein
MSSSPNLGIALLAQSQNLKYVTVNAAIDALDNAGNGVAGIAMGNANQTLTAAQFTGSQVFQCTGSDTANRNLTVPNTMRVFIVSNQTTGGFGVVVRTSTPGTTITVAAGTAQLLYCDGSNNIVAVS